MESKEQYLRRLTAQIELLQSQVTEANGFYTDLIHKINDTKTELRELEANKQLTIANMVSSIQKEINNKNLELKEVGYDVVNNRKLIDKERSVFDKSKQEVKDLKSKLLSEIVRYSEKYKKYKTLSDELENKQIALDKRYETLDIATQKSIKVLHQNEVSLQIAKDNRDIVLRDKRNWEEKKADEYAIITAKKKELKKEAQIIYDEKTKLLELIKLSKDEQERTMAEMRTLLNAKQFLNK